MIHTRRAGTVLVTTLTTVALLSGCSDKGTTSSTGTTPTASSTATGTGQDAAVSTATQTAAPSSDGAATTSPADAGSATSAPGSGDTATGTQSAPATRTIRAHDGSFTFELPDGWIDAADKVDPTQAVAAAQAAERVDGFFTNVVVSREKDVRNLEASLRRTATQMAGKDGSSTLLDPVTVDGRKAIGYRLTRTVSSLKIDQTQRWVRVDGRLYVITFSTTHAQAKAAEPVLHQLLSSWSWKAGAAR